MAHETDSGVELPLLASPRRDFVLISNQTELDAATEALARAQGAFALDAERASGFRYGQRAYLIQVARADSPLYLIDTASLSPSAEREPFAQLGKVLSQGTWILHAATQDLPCLAELGFRPTSIFDTELGGRLAGLERVGLGAMCENLLGLKLAKEHSAVDWSARPLQESWLNYAALDIDVLPELMNAVHQLLESQGKLDFAKQEFENLLDFRPKPPKPDRWRGTSGAHELKDAKKLAILKAIWHAREDLAQKLDVSPGRLIPDAALTAVAANAPRSRSELAGRKDFHGRASRTYLDTWWQAIERGANELNLPPLRLPAEGIPNHRNWATKFPEADARLKSARDTVAKLSEQLRIPAENLLTPDYLRQLCWQPPEPLHAETLSSFLLDLGARPWQVETLAQPLLVALTQLPAEGEK